MKIYRHDSVEGKEILTSLPIQFSTQKIDGSFLTFEKEDGELKIRSKTQDIRRDWDPMFKPVVSYLELIVDTVPDHIRFYCEYVRRLRHNRIAYDRLPMNNLVCWLMHDKMTGHWFIPDLDNVYCRLLHIDRITNVDLGGRISEGEVIHCFSEDHKQHGAVKIINPEFAEAHGKKRIVKQNDVVSTIMSSHILENRWYKALFRLRERGVLTNSAEDIGKLLKEISVDFETEEKETIKEELWLWYRKSFIKSSHIGFAEWYLGSQL